MREILISPWRPTFFLFLFFSLPDPTGCFSSSLFFLFFLRPILTRLDIVVVVVVVVVVTLLPGIIGEAVHEVKERRRYRLIYFWFDINHSMERIFSPPLWNFSFSLSLKFHHGIWLRFALILCTLSYRSYFY